MKKTLNELAIYCHITAHAIRPYMCRAEFASCQTPKTNVFNISQEQMERLKDLVLRRNGQRGYYAEEQNITRK